jgi:hypothetical protein
MNPGFSAPLPADLMHAEAAPLSARETLIYSARWSSLA